MNEETPKEEPPSSTGAEEPGDDGVLDAAAHPRTPGAAYSARGDRDDEDSAVDDDR